MRVVNSSLIQILAASVSPERESFIVEALEESFLQIQISLVVFGQRDELLHEQKLSLSKYITLLQLKILTGSQFSCLLFTL